MANRTKKGEIATYCARYFQSVANREPPARRVMGEELLHGVELAQPPLVELARIVGQLLDVVLDRRVRFDERQQVLRQQVPDLGERRRVVERRGHLTDEVGVHPVDLLWAGDR